MSEYEFQLIFRLDKGEDPTDFLDALFEAGCDDSTVSTGALGYIALDFIRESNTAKEALITAIQNVKTAIPHAKLEDAGPDLLNLSELAFLFGYTKQNMRKYAKGEMATIQADFPSPVITGKISYWHSAQVAQWLKHHTNIEVNDIMLETLFTIWSLNQANSILNQPNPEMTASFTSLLNEVA